MRKMFPRKLARDEKKDLEAIKGLASDERWLTPIINSIDTYFLIASIQVSISHPEMTPDMREMLTQIGEDFQTALCAIHPEVRDILDAGWADARDNVPRH